LWLEIGADQPVSRYDGNPQNPGSVEIGLLRPQIIEELETIGMPRDLSRPNAQEIVHPCTISCAFAEFSSLAELSLLSASETAIRFFGCTECQKSLKNRHLCIPLTLPFFDCNCFWKKAVFGKNFAKKFFHPAFWEVDFAALSPPGRDCSRHAI